MPNPIRLAVLSDGVGDAVQQALADYLAQEGLALQIVQATSWSQFISVLGAPDTHLACVPRDALGVAFGEEVVKDLTPYQGYFGAKGSRISAQGDGPAAIDMDSIAQSLIVPTIQVPDATVQAFMAVCGWIFCGGGAPVPNNPTPPNSFDFDIVPPASATGTPPTMKGSEIKCTPQTITINTHPVNSHLVHVIWKKAPPGGGASVERHALDNQGDAPKNKTPSTARMSPERQLSAAEWNVPFCSPGAYVITVTCIWECEVDGVQHELTKTLTITVT